MIKLARHILSSSQVAVILVTILSLMISGVSSAERLSNLYDQIAEQNPTVNHAQLIQGPPAPEDITNEMTPGERPNTEQSACIWQSVPFSKNNGDEHFQLLKYFTPTFSRIEYSGQSSRTIESSVSLISSDLGRQFTLVGARPSGTS